MLITGLMSPYPQLEAVSDHLADKCQLPARAHHLGGAPLEVCARVLASFLPAAKEGRVAHAERKALSIPDGGQQDACKSGL